MKVFGLTVRREGVNPSETPSSTPSPPHTPRPSQPPGLGQAASPWAVLTQLRNSAERALGGNSFTRGI